jgi:hypothetical protein
VEEEEKENEEILKNIQRGRYVIFEEEDEKKVEKKILRKLHEGR